MKVCITFLHTHKLNTQETQHMGERNTHNQHTTHTQETQYTMSDMRLSPHETVSCIQPENTTCLNPHLSVSADYTKVSTATHL